MRKTAAIKINCEMKSTMRAPSCFMQSANS
jgi:hypothetical protein